MFPKAQRHGFSNPFMKSESTGVAYTIGALFLIIVGYLLWRTTPANGTGGVYQSTKHGNPTSGVRRILSEPTGDCTQCHDEHASRDSVPTPGGPYDYLLFKTNDNNLCYTSDGAGPCHASAGTNQIYQGPITYENSSHRISMNAYWPGPTPPSRPSSDFGKCLNCHTPHGYNDASGLVPSQTFSREENLCQTCHDGSPAKNIQSEITKTNRHPASNYSSRHNQSEDGTASNYGSANRHSECVDCHNPHYAKADAITPSPPNASNRTKGVSGVEVFNGAAGSQPSYTYRSPSVGIDYEYQLCFKCHSSWTTQPGGQSDMAKLFNPNNPSYHPVETLGKNTNIDSRAFVNGWKPTDRLYCTSCHTSDNSSVRGPHGSQYRYILKKDYPSGAVRTMSPNEICFDCHNYDTYANANASGTVKKYSRFDRHDKHTANKQYPCYTCHGSHASTSLPHLIVTGRQPGVVEYIERPNGGSCRGTPGLPECHTNLEDYTVSYPR